ncbi:uncharacterized protein [Centruroides vittatus]|uniref:uncharacterized protein n=1 Tax=Centruroides vittatus TaxID=120091 RepID=UPI0035102376
MKLMLELFIFAFAFSPIICWHEPNVRPSDPYKALIQSNGRYCAMSEEDRADVNFCLMENRNFLLLEFYKNCIQQLKFFQTMAEINNFICQARQTAPQVYAKFIKCFAPAKYTLSLDDPKLYPTLNKCYNQIENRSQKSITLDHPHQQKFVLL